MYVWSYPVCSFRFLDSRRAKRIVDKALSKLRNIFANYSSSMTDPSNSKQSMSGLGRLVKSIQTGVQKKRDEMREASDAKAAGKVWNPETKEWYFYTLDEEFKALEVAQESFATSMSMGSENDERPVADRSYYDLLKVSTSADASSIKKAYYREARKCHPDKNPDDPEAHVKFAQLGHAYQILSDEKARAAYDRDGKPDTANSAEALQEIDPSVFFNVMFGSSLVEPYIGELWLASQTDTMMKDAGSMPDTENMSDEQRDEVLKETLEALEKKNELKQKKRYVKCARYLRERVKLYAKDPVAFTLGCGEEAEKIAAGAYGDLYCRTIGFAFQVAAEEYLGFEKTLFGLGGHVARTKKNASGFASGMSLLGAGIKAAGAGVKVMKEAEEMQKTADRGQEVGEQEAQQMAVALEGSVPAFLAFAWAVNKRDIQSTLRACCKKVFDDASVPKDERIKRAEAVRILGKEFQMVGKKQQMTQKSEFSSDDAVARLAVASKTAMAKAQGQEVTEEDQEQMLKQAKMEMEASASEKQAGRQANSSNSVDGGS